MMKTSGIALCTWIAMTIFGCQEKPVQQKKPNILFAISDDQSFAHTSFVGCSFINTPAFDRIAREGIYFTNCYASSPGCAPSRGALITGRHHWQNEQSGQHASSWLKKYVPFVDLLAKNGYAIGRTGKGVDPFQYARNENDSLWRISNAAGPEYSRISYNDQNDERFAKGISKLNYFDNFKYFIDSIKGDKPFFFWYGSHEPHRSYEKGSWKRMGKKLEDVKVPGFLPDNAEIRGDLLDYAVEIEWFDLHLLRMLSYLDRIGELDNTVVIVTADNGMPFPRAKANCYEYGFHVPLAVYYPRSFPGKRVVTDPVSFVDFAPTILDLTGTSSKGMQPISGKSILNILRNDKQSVKDRTGYEFAGRERHSCSRYLNWGYPQRVISNEDYIYIWNVRPERWPAGAPQRFDPNNENILWPLYGLDGNGKYINDGSFTDIDDSPSKSFIIEHFGNPMVSKYFDLALGKRPEYELFNVTEDPYCLNNLAGNADYAAIENQLKNRLNMELKESEDPRIAGPDTEIFDSYKRYSKMRKFPKPDYLK